MVKEFGATGWVRFGQDAVVGDWVQHALPAARAALGDPDLAHWYRCENTWFVGVDALPNDAQGRIAGSGPLTGAGWARFAAKHIGPLPGLHRAQLSVVFAGYPRPGAGETPAAFGYRKNRCGAHVDGLLAVGPDRRRMLREPHGFIVGMPLGHAHPDAAPLVIWEGSHQIVRDALAEVLEDHDPADWGDVDVTEAYHAARREAFECCPLRRLAAAPGEAILLHRHMLHGIAPWGADVPREHGPRMIAYFRPEITGHMAGWLSA